MRIAHHALAARDRRPSPLVCGLLLILLAPVLAPAQPDARAERKARAVLGKLERVVRGGDWRKAWPLLGSLRDEHGDTEVTAGASDRIAAWERHARYHLFGGAAALHGRLEPAKKGALRLSYDLEAADAMTWTDFETIQHLPDAESLFRVGTRVRGSGALVVKAPFLDPVHVEVELDVEKRQDLGVVVMDPDEKTRFLVAAAANRFFATKYDADRNVVAGHVLVYCGRGAESLAENYPSQILASRSASAMPSRLALGLEVNRNRLVFEVGKTIVKGALTGEDQRFERARLGLHLYRGDVRLRRLVIEGRIDPKWAEERAPTVRRRLPPLPDGE